MNTAEQAVNIAISLVNSGTYQLGTGDYDTPNGGQFDCFGFAFNKCYGIKRHRPGFNHGPWASVEDDLNCNSAIEDARHHRELFEEVIDRAQIKPGDLLAYPTFHLKSDDGVLHNYIGHIGIVEHVYPTYQKSRSFVELSIIQCHGPNGNKPGIVHTDGSVWAHHDSVWPKPEHRTVILRPHYSR